MENKQTAVEWLINLLKENDVSHGMFWITSQDEVFEKAKQMEDEQLLKKYGEGYDEGLYDGMNK